MLPKCFRDKTCAPAQLPNLNARSWVNAAHTHGVPVLGTLITEWDAGAAACHALFGTREAAKAAAAALAAIAAHRGFEGW